LYCSSGLLPFALLDLIFGGSGQNQRREPPKAVEPKPQGRASTSPEGQAYLERQRREHEEKERIQKESCQREAEERKRREAEERKRGEEESLQIWRRYHPCNGEWEQSSEEQVQPSLRQTSEGAYLAEQRRREEMERVLREQAELRAREKWRKYYESKSMTDIAEMSGLEFEEFLARLLPKIGYTNVCRTPANDQGADLICESPEGVRTVVQAKRWKKSLGNEVVQEILGAMLYYDCTAGVIITNSRFTDPARILATKHAQITLCDGKWLEEQIREHAAPAVIPEFNWDEYNRVVSFPFRRANEATASDVLATLLMRLDAKKNGRADCSEPVTAPYRSSESPRIITPISIPAPARAGKKRTYPGCKRIPIMDRHRGSDHRGLARFLFLHRFAGFFGSVIS
jgi:Restriction endonuclease